LISGISVCDSSSSGVDVVSLIAKMVVADPTSSMSVLLISALISEIKKTIMLLFK